MAEYSFTVENFLRSRKEAEALFHEQYALMDCDRDAVPLDPNYDELEEAARIGRTLFIACRYGDQLVGYYFAVLQNHLFNHNSLTSFQLGFYLRPQHRSGGRAMRMLKMAEEWMRARGVKRMYSGANIEFQDGRVGHLLERMGYKPIEVSYSKIL